MEIRACIDRWRRTDWCTDPFRLAAADCQVVDDVLEGHHPPHGTRATDDDAEDDVTAVFERVFDQALDGRQWELAWRLAAHPRCQASRNITTMCLYRLSHTDVFDHNVTMARARTLCGILSERADAAPLIRDVERMVWMVLEPVWNTIRFTNLRYNLPFERTCTDHLMFLLRFFRHSHEWFMPGAAAPGSGDRHNRTRAWDMLCLLASKDDGWRAIFQWQQRAVRWHARRTLWLLRQLRDGQRVRWAGRNTIGH